MGTMDRRLVVHVSFELGELAETMAHDARCTMSAWLRTLMEEEARRQRLLPPQRPSQRRSRKPR